MSAVSYSSSTLESNEQFTAMPPPDADLETTWRFLEAGFIHIMTNGVSYSKYMILYTVTMNYCSFPRSWRGQDAGLYKGRAVTRMCLLSPQRH